MFTVVIVGESTAPAAAGSRRLVVCPRCANRSIRAARTACPVCACTEHAGAAPEARAGRAGAAGPGAPAPALRPEGSRGASVVFVLGLTALLCAWLAPLASPPLVVATLAAAVVAGRGEVPAVDTWLRRVGVGICLALVVLLAFGFVMGRLSAGT